MALEALLLGAVGLAVGSFLTVVVERTASGQTLVRGRSHCPRCGIVLRWIELLPLFSFLAQGGRCRSCGQAISPRYFVIELATAVLFLAVGAAVWYGTSALPPFLTANGFSPAASVAGVLTVAYYAVFASVAVAVSAYDITRRLIPVRLLSPLLVVGLSAQAVGAVSSGSGSRLLLAGAMMTSAFLLFWAIWFFSGGRAMGRGDADVALATASYLDPATALLGLLASFWIGAGVGILLVAAGRRSWSDAIPFAPFLFAGAMAAILLWRIIRPAGAFYGL